MKNNVGKVRKKMENIECMSDFLNVYTLILKNKLIVVIQEKKSTDKLKWRLKLFHEGNCVYDDKKYKQRKRWILPLTGAGCWNVYIFGKKKKRFLLRIRKSVWYYPKGCKNSFQQFYSKYEDFSEELPLASLKYPYQNMALLHYRKNTFEKNTLEKCKQSLNEDLQWSNLSSFGEYEHIVISEQKIHKVGECNVFFSGKTKYNKRLIFGQDDISEGVDMNELMDEIGYFSAISQTPDEIVVTNDYFGMCPLYSYETDLFCVISNSFHLLVLLLKNLKIKLELDVDHIIPYMTYGERMVLEQLASHQTFIKGVRKVPIHAKYLITKEGCRQVEKSIFEVMKKSIAFSMDKYQMLIKQYAEEIVENVELARNDTRFDNVILDVSGGKDSRVILAAAMNCMPSGDERIKVNSVDVQDKKDKDSFIPLNHLHSFLYDDCSATLKIENIKSKWQQRRSAYLSTIFSYDIPWEFRRTADYAPYLQLTGAGGGMLFCAYYPMNFVPVSYEGLDQMVDSIAALNNNSIVKYKKVAPYMKTVFREGLQEVIGDTLYEKLNNYYLYFRNTYHFGPEVLYNWTEGQREQWCPLYSKTAFSIRQMVNQEFKGIRFSLDLINQLSPILLNVPFNDPKYNSELAQLMETDPELNKDYRNVQIEQNMDTTEWDVAKEIKAQKRCIVNSEEQERIKLENVQLRNEFYDTAMRRLNKMLHYDKRFKKVLGLDLFLKFYENKERIIDKKPLRDLSFLFHKITAVTDLIDLID